MEIDEAKKNGAMALFGEKYSQIVRTVKMGDYSFELCGGCHVANTAQIGLVKILSESSVSSGVRRIEAVTGFGVMNYIYEEDERIVKTAAALKSNTGEIDQRAAAVMDELKAAQKQIEVLNGKLARNSAADIVAEGKEINGVAFLAKRLDGADVNALRTLGDQLKAKLGCAYILLAGVNAGKITFISMATDDAVKRGIHAGNLVKEAAKITGGGGGGKPASAQAGGSDVSKLNEAFTAVEKLISNI